MNRTVVALSFLALGATFASCRSHIREYYVGADDYVLATRDGPEGRKETYRLDTRGDASLRVTTEYQQERPELGLVAIEIDKAQAEARGVKPYQGLLIKSVRAKSCAQEAGLQVGDVLLAVDGRETVYLPQLVELRSRLQAEQSVPVKVLRGQEPMDLTIVVKVERERVTEEITVPLDAPPLPSRAYAGVGLRGIPAATCERMFGAPRQAVVVSSVEVGSPAWVAGIRAGDVIDTVDGAPVPEVNELQRRIAEGGEAGRAMALGVRRGPTQRHEGEVQLADYRDDSGAWIPLIFWLDNGTYEDRWSVGPFGLVMSNRNHYIADSTTRRVKTRNVFSALLGLFRVETTPEETEVRLLWLIRFDT